MKRMVFTDAFIRKLKPEVKKIIRGEGNGFCVRVMPSGLKTFLYVYTIDNRRRELALGLHDPGYLNPETKLGSLAEARQKFEDARRKVVNGIDPLAEQEQVAEERRLAPTVEKLAEEYIEKHAMIEKKSWQEDKRALDVEILPIWGKIKAKNIRKRDVILLLEGVVKRGAPVMANRLRALIHKMFAFAVDRDIIENNPCSGVKPLVSEKPRERALSENEIKAFWNSLDDPDMIASDDIRRAFRMIMATGQRPGEVAGMHSDEIDGNWWTIPSDRSKNGKSHRVFLTETAKSIVGKRSGYIFPSPRPVILPDESVKIVPITVGSLANALRRNIKGQSYRRKLLKRGHIKELPEDPNRVGVEFFTPHDLRRTVATRMAEMGIMEEIIDRVLNHTRQGIIRTYNHYAYDKEIQSALLSWEKKLLYIIAEKTNPVHQQT